MTDPANRYPLRAATIQDLPALAALDAAHTRRATGSAQRTRGEIAIEWKAPAFDLAQDSRVAVSSDGTIVGWGEVIDGSPHVRMASRLRLDPATPDESAASALVSWCIERARRNLEIAPPQSRVCLTQGAYATDQQAITRLEAAGFTYARSFLRMRTDLDEMPCAPIWPDDVSIRTFVKGQDDLAAVEAYREIFRDHWGYIESPLNEDLGEWRQWIYEDEEFDTDLWFLAIAGGEIIGFCQCYPFVGEDRTTGLIDDLGVRRDWRRRGLATAFLRHAFRAFRRRGVRAVELGVDSDSLTGATRVYERVGMTAIWEHRVYELELRSGMEEATTDVGDE